LRDRVTVSEAARRLGVTQAAIRKRIERGTIEVERDDLDGLTYVYINRDIQGDTSHDAVVEGLRERIADQQDQIAHLRKQLDESNEANRENRRIIAILTQRIPELEPAREPASVPREQTETAPETEGKDEETPADMERRPWWQRMFGG
jgi:hypothetical protein